MNNPRELAKFFTIISFLLPLLLPIPFQPLLAGGHDSLRQCMENTGFGSEYLTWKKKVDQTLDPKRVSDFDVNKEFEKSIQEVCKGVGIPLLPVPWWLKAYCFAEKKFIDLSSSKKKQAILKAARAYYSYVKTELNGRGVPWWKPCNVHPGANNKMTLDPLDRNNFSVPNSLEKYRKPIAAILFKHVLDYCRTKQKAFNLIDKRCKEVPDLRNLRYDRAIRKARDHYLFTKPHHPPGVVTDNQNDDHKAKDWIVADQIPKSGYFLPRYGDIDVRLDRELLDLKIECPNMTVPPDMEVFRIGARATFRAVDHEYVEEVTSKVEWESDNPGILKIRKGKARVKHPGKDVSVLVTAIYREGKNRKAADCLLHIQGGPPPRLLLETEGGTGLDSTVTTKRLHAYLVDNRGRRIEVTRDPRLTWESSSKSIQVSPNGTARIQVGPDGQVPSIRASMKKSGYVITSPWLRFKVTSNIQKPGLTLLVQPRKSTYPPGSCLDFFVKLSHVPDKSPRLQWHIDDRVFSFSAKKIRQCFHSPGKHRIQVSLMGTEKTPLASDSQIVFIQKPPTTQKTNRQMITWGRVTPVGNNRADTEQLYIHLSRPAKIVAIRGNAGYFCFSNVRLMKELFCTPTRKKSGYIGKVYPPDDYIVTPVGAGYIEIEFQYVDHPSNGAGSKQGSVKVPDLHCLSLRNAESKLKRYGLSIAGQTSSRYDPDCGPGQVVQQFPSSGRTVPSGSKVHVAINPEKAPQILLKVYPEQPTYHLGDRIEFIALVANNDKTTYLEWRIDGETIKNSSQKVSKRFRLPGDHKVQVSIVGPDNKELAFATRYIFVAYPPEPSLSIKLFPEKPEYQIGDKVVLEASVKNPPESWELQWYKNDQYLGSGKRQTIVLKERGHLKITLILRTDSSFDGKSLQRTLLVGDRPVGPLGKKRNLFEGTLRGNRLSLCSRYWMGGYGKWSECRTFATLQNVKEYRLISCPQSDGFNTGYLVYRPVYSRELRFAVLHFRFGDPQTNSNAYLGFIEYSGTIPESKDYLNGTLFLRCHSYAADLSWRTSTGQLCKTKIWKYNKSNGSSSNVFLKGGVERTECSKNPDSGKGKSSIPWGIKAKLQSAP